MKKLFKELQMKMESHLAKGEYSDVAYLANIRQTLLSVK